MSRMLLFLLLGLAVSVGLTLVFPGFFFLFLPVVFLPLAMKKRPSGEPGG